jgi:hypothetical protein
LIDRLVGEARKSCAGATRPAGGGFRRQTPGPPWFLLNLWATGVIISTRVQVVRNAKLLHCHWLPRTALYIGSGEMAEHDSSAVPPINTAAVAASASRLRVNHRLIILQLSCPQLEPAFRRLAIRPEPPFHEFRKVTGTSKRMILVPLSIESSWT